MRQYRTRVLMIAVHSALLASCGSGGGESSNASDEQVRHPQRGLNWTAGPDGSQIAISDGGELGPFPKDIHRCWKFRAEQDCLVIRTSLTSSPEGEAATGDSIRWLARYRSHKLPSDPSIGDKLNPVRGYSCQLSDGQYATVFSEHITNGFGYIAQNNFDLRNPLSSQRPWSRAYVTSFMVKNGLKAGDTYFDCAELAYQIINASEEVLTTTSVSYDTIVGGESADAMQ